MVTIAAVDWSADTAAEDGAWRTLLVAGTTVEKWVTCTASTLNKGNDHIVYLDGVDVGGIDFDGECRAEEHRDGKT